PDAHQRAEMVTDLLSSADKVDVEKALDIAFSTQVWHAELWQARLKDAWQHASSADKSGDVEHVSQLILGWDRKSGAESAGALAFYALKKALGGDISSRTEPPPGLSDEKILEALRGGSVWLRTTFGEVEVPFGRYFRVGRRPGDRSWPVGGGSLRDV